MWANICLRESIIGVGGFVSGRITTWLFWRRQVSLLRGRLSESESRVGDLQSDLSLLSQLTALTQASLGSSQEELLAVSEELAQLYHQVCLAHGQTPHRVMLEHMQNVKSLGRC